MTRTTPQAHISRPFLLTLVLGAFLLMVLPTPVVHAATITVNSAAGTKINGDGACTLREAIENANNNAATWIDCAMGSGDDTIDLPAGVIITLTEVDNGAGTVNANGLPVIASNITINGNNATIERSSAGGTLYFRIFSVNPNRTLTLNNVTIRNGRTPDGGGSASGMGGGIASFGTVVVNNSTISGNRTGDGTGGGQGGGIANAGTGGLTITNSTISSNAAGQNGIGGGIYNGGTLNISNSTISGNTVGAGSGGGGGIYNNSGATMNLTDTWISNNTAGNSTSGGDGGGIYNGSSVTANITNSSISGNTAGNGSTSDGGSGGGIYQMSGTLTITNTTISGNTAGNGTSPGMGGRGGGIYNGGTLVLTNSTLSGNATGTPSGDGGGILNYGTLDVTSSTIANNTAAWNGGGIKTNTATAAVKNTILANNTAVSAPSYANCTGPITNGGNNLDSGTSCGWGSANGSLSNTDPLLGVLASNGGSRQTLALQAGSPAIDGVTSTPPNSSPATDERGAARPQGARHDIGAYEAVFITVNDTSGGTGTPGCKLRDAITAANKDTATGGCTAGLGPDIVVLPTSATITLAVVDNGSGIDANGLPVVTSTITINSNNAIVERSSAGGTPAFRIFSVGDIGMLTLNNVTIRNGKAPNGTMPGQPGGYGGGISSFGTLNVNNSTISGNRTGDGMSSGGSGGGIYIGSGTATITDSTISGNSTGNGSIGNGGRGAGIYANVFLTLTNSTITGNVTGAPNGVGGGVETGSSSVSVTSSTIANNTASLSGGGLRSGTGEIILRNTIVANNTASINPNCDGAVTNGGNNLDSGTTCNWDSTNGSMSSTNPLLGPLGNYGGPTQTMPLGTGSPAIDGVTWTAPNNSPSNDQRGFARPYGVRHDIGAYEYYPLYYLPAITKNSP